MHTPSSPQMGNSQSNSLNCNISFSLLEMQHHILVHVLGICFNVMAMVYTCPLLYGLRDQRGKNITLALHPNHSGQPQVKVQMANLSSTMIPQARGGPFISAKSSAPFLSRLRTKLCTNLVPHKGGTASPIFEIAMGHNCFLLLEIERHNLVHVLGICFNVMAYGSLLPIVICTGSSDRKKCNPSPKT